MTPTQRGSGPDGGTDPSGRLIAEWAVCGIAVAAARFVPVPLLDDSIRHRATQVAVVRTLRAQGRGFGSDEIEPIYAGVDAASASTAHRALTYLRSVPRRVVLFPVRKYVALFGSVRGVPTDVMTTVLLARTLYRTLGAGRLADGTDEEALRAEAAVIRQAFDDSLRGMDLRLLTGALSDVLSEGRGLTRASVGFARTTFGRLRKDDEAVGDLEPGGPVGEGAEKVEEVLRRPEIAQKVAQFDATVDSKLAAAAKAPKRR